MAETYHIVCVYIDGDCAKTLGSSVQRDITNVRSAVKKIISDNNVRSSDNNICYNLDEHIYNATSTHSCIVDFAASVKQSMIAKYKQQLMVKLFLLYISGHGYQTKSKNKDESDGLDEYIIVSKNERVLDDDLKKLFIDDMITDDKLQLAENIVCIADTCHSGTMLDFETRITKVTDYRAHIDNVSNNRNRPHILCLSACADNELENCDIGNTVGFGGALTIQLLEPNDVCCNCKPGSLLHDGRLPLECILFHSLECILNTINENISIILKKSFNQTVYLCGK